MKSVVFAVCFLALALFAGSCKKENDSTGPQNPGGNEDSIYIFDGDKSLKNTIQYLVRDKESASDFFVFGKRNAANVVEEYTSMVVRKRSAPDTLLHVELDDKKRTSAFYASVKSVKDSLYYTLSYSDDEDSILVSRYRIDWNTGTRILRWRSIVKNNGAGFGLGEVTGYEGRRGDADLSFIIGTFAKIGSVVLIAAGGAAGLGICGLPCGIAAATLVASILDSGTASANSSTLPTGIYVNIDGSQVFVTSAFNILTNRSWRPVSFLENGVQTGDPCEMDNTYIFGSDGKLTILMTGNPCSPLESTVVVDWFLYDNEQSLYIGDSDLSYWTIKEISADKVVLFCVDNSTGQNIQVYLVLRII